MEDKFAEVKAKEEAEKMMILKARGEDLIQLVQGVHGTLRMLQQATALKEAEGIRKERAKVAQSLLTTLWRSQLSYRAEARTLLEKIAKNSGLKLPSQVDEAMEEIDKAREGNTPDKELQGGTVPSTGKKVTPDIPSIHKVPDLRPDRK